ncbi:Signal transduction histidine kinase HoxJ (hydrogenase regulation) [hydrothermal vent metagenome]|uniref:Signal transduction histidine kinase HoxJ (Hydrogenase regulation) n=1 Tax=hydrothermal vent metagenome TaxID=652676 RepID=A0A3B1C457_9ZZZZ
MSKGAEENYASLIDRAGVTESLELTPSTESVWIEVIQKMDSVYADLVRSQVELEEKNVALEEAQQFIDSVLSAMTDVLIVCDTDGVIQQVNAALEKLTGRPAKDFLRCSLEQLFSDEAAAMLETFPEKLGHEALNDCEVSIVCADGSSAPLAMNCSSRYDRDGALLGLVLIGRPIGELRRAYDDLNQTLYELKQAQQQLVHAEKMASLGRLVAGVAHELNNPISFVFGNMHALKRYTSRISEYLNEVDAQVDSPSLQQLRRDLKIDHILKDMQPLVDGTLEGAERVSDIVQDLRRYSGVQKEACSRFDLPRLIRKAVQWVLQASRVTPEVSYSLPDSLEIEGHKGQIHQILVNLVQNALDAMAQQTRPELSLSCETVADLVRIDVLDQGPGIAEKDRAKIFEPFFTRKAVGKGTGLGLYISYGLARDLGGDLRAENHPQGGALFTLTLPFNTKA